MYYADGTIESNELDAKVNGNLSYSEILNKVRVHLKDETAFTHKRKQG
ncbi:hypothetical protein [Paenibacillus sp. LjRoot56]